MSPTAVPSTGPLQACQWTHLTVLSHPPPLSAYHCQYCFMGWILVIPPLLCAHGPPFPPLAASAPLPPPHHEGPTQCGMPEQGSQTQAPCSTPQIDPSEVCPWGSLGGLYC